MEFYLGISTLLFFIAISGILLNRSNLLLILVSLELLTLAINLNFLWMSIWVDDIRGEWISLLLLTVAAAESAIGLAILVAMFRLSSSIGIKLVSRIKG